jgi:hypothetical protein
MQRSASYGTLRCSGFAKTLCFVPFGFSPGQAVDDGVEKTLGDVPYVEKEVEEQERQEQNALRCAVQEAGGSHLIKGGEIAEVVLGADEYEEKKPCKELHLSKEK